MATYWTRHLLCTKKAGAYMNNTYSMCQLSIKSNRDERDYKAMALMFNQFSKKLFCCCCFFFSHKLTYGIKRLPEQSCRLFSIFKKKKKKAKTCLTYFLISFVLLLYLSLFALGHTNTYVTAYEDNLNKSNSELISKYKIHLHFSH